MSKAAARESLKNDDFVQLSEFKSGQSALQPPVVPSLIDTVSGPTTGGDDDDDNEDGARVQPISISLLKEYMQKRIQKSLAKKHQQSAMNSNQIALQQIAVANVAGSEKIIPRKGQSPVSAEMVELQTILE